MTSLEEVPGRRQRLISSAVLNVLGQAAPALVALVSVREVVLTLGVERFGILAIAWAAVAYAGIFDLGTGRALTQGLAAARDASPEHRGAVLGSGFAITVVFGCCAGLLVWAAAEPFARLLTREAPLLHAEVAATVRVMAGLVPLAVLTPAVRSVLEAGRRFGALNAITMPANLATYVVPALIVRATPSLPAVITGLLLVRGAMIVGLLLVSFKVEPAMRVLGAQRRHARMLLGFGGWATVSNVVSPLIVQLDRVLLGTAGSLAALGVYAVPAEVLARARVIPGAITQVLFPSFSEALAHDPAKARMLLAGALKAMFALMFAGTLFVVAIAPEALGLWLGSPPSAETVGTTRLLAVALLVNAVAFPAFAFIQASGRPRLTANIHLVELPVHVVVVWGLIARFGALGAAGATLIRHLIDTTAMLWVAVRIVPARRARLAAHAWVVAGAALALAGACVPWGLGTRLVVAVVLGSAVLAAGWRNVLDGSERSWCKRGVSRLVGRQAEPAR